MAARLLERLAMLDLSDDQRRMLGVQDTLLVSVRTHLLGLLNTPAGSVRTDPDYGVPDLSTGPGNLDLPAVEVMAQALLAVIHRYEPRIVRPTLKVVLGHADNIAYRLVLEGQLGSDDERRPLRLEGTIGADGAIDLDPIEQGWQ
jgi:type VI secretion system protein